MNEKRNKHRHNRAMRGFDNHRASHYNRRAGGEFRHGRPWRFFGAANRTRDTFEPHFRFVSRTAALGGNHIRRVEEPVRAAHGKS